MNVTIEYHVQARVMLELPQPRSFMPTESYEGRSRVLRLARIAGLVLAAVATGSTAFAQPNDPAPPTPVVEPVAPAPPSAPVPPATPEKSSETTALEQRIQLLEEQAPANAATKTHD